MTLDYVVLRGWGVCHGFYYDEVGVKIKGGVKLSILVVYDESMKRNLKIKPIYECRCNGRLQTYRFTRLSHTSILYGNLSLFYHTIFTTKSKMKGKSLFF